MFVRSGTGTEVWYDGEYMYNCTCQLAEFDLQLVLLQCNLYKITGSMNIIIENYWTHWRHNQNTYCNNCCL